MVTFHSRQQEEWGVKDGSKEEVLSYFEGIQEALSLWLAEQKDVLSTILKTGKLPSPQVVDTGPDVEDETHAA